MQSYQKHLDDSILMELGCDASALEDLDLKAEIMKANGDAQVFMEHAKKLERRVKVQRSFKRKLECRVLTLRTKNDQLTAANAALAQTARRARREVRAAKAALGKTARYARRELLAARRQNGRLRRDIDSLLKRNAALQHTVNNLQVESLR
eukprot:375363-Rhodomonas_salina.1